MATDKHTLQTADKTLVAIELLANTGKQLSVNEISKAMGISRTATYALLNSLELKDFVERDPSTKKYSIGFKILELGMKYRYKYYFMAACERGVFTLARKWRYQINLSILREPANCVFLITKAPEDYHRTTPHAVMPAYATSGGKMLLSGLPDDELSKQLNSIELKKSARCTIDDKTALMEELLRIRNDGYAVEREENFNGRGCIACPIYDATNTMIAAISMVMPIEIIDTKFETFLHDIEDAASEISQELGYNPYTMK